MTIPSKKLKKPAYQWYPGDFCVDEPVLLMSLEEEGAYRRLLDHQWLHGSVPRDIRQLAAICKGITLARMKRVWQAVGPCFPPSPDDPERLQNRRLERQRVQDQEYRKAMVNSGQAGAQKRWGKRGKATKSEAKDDSHPNSHPNGVATQRPIASDSSSSSPSVEPSPTAKAVVEGPPRGDGGAIANGADDGATVPGWGEWCNRVPEHLRPAVDGAVRAAQNPAAIQRELVGLTEPITGGAAYPPTVVAQALHELAVAGGRVTSAALRSFCRRIVTDGAKGGSDGLSPGERVLRMLGDAA
jgi:uncharacterized protein YdaU (DUF1376 family)